jgi:colicin import membrane protein
MENRKGTPKAVILAAILHLGIVAFLFLAILPCSDYEAFVERLGLPAGWNPITCSRPLELPGQVINAVLIGPTGSPPPKVAKVPPVKDSTPPPPAPPPPTPPPPEKQPDRPLPPPPKQPDVKDQERVVADALQKAEDAKKEQEEKQRQQQAELDAQAAKAKKQKEIDELFNKLDQAQANTKKADAQKKVAQQKTDELKNAKTDALPDLPAADQKQTGTNGADNGLLARYQAAIQNAVTQNWIRPDSIPEGKACIVHIVQVPGGDVLSVNVDSSCPYDAAGRQSVENAVLAAKPLPYQGFETVFQRNLTFTFRPQ